MQFIAAETPGTGRERVVLHSRRYLTKDTAPLIGVGNTRLAQRYLLRRRHLRR